MADPQTEEGYTRIANELLDAICRFDFGKRETKVLLAVIRKTYGYHKKTDAISIWQIAQMTGLDRANISRTMESLLSRQILIHAGGKMSHGQEIRMVGVNKHYNEWLTDVELTPVPNQHRCQNDMRTDVVLAQEPMSKRQPQKKVTKERKKDSCASDDALEYPADFDRFWSAYPRKKSKGDAFKAWKKIKPSEHLAGAILQAVQRATTSADWLKDGGRFIPYPASWLNARGWEDENDQQQKLRRVVV